MPTKPTAPGRDATDVLAPVTVLFPISEGSGTALADLGGAGHDLAIPGDATFGDDPTWGRYVAFPSDGGFVTFPPISKANCSLVVVSSSENEFNVFQATLGNSDGSDYANGIRAWQSGDTDCSFMDGADFVVTPRHNSAVGGVHARIMSISGDTMSYFVDGVLVGTAVKPSGPTTSTVNRVAFTISSRAKFFLVAVVPRALTLADAVAFAADPYGAIDGATGGGGGGGPVDPPPVGGFAISGTPRVNGSGWSLEWKYPGPVTYQAGHAPSVSIDGGPAVYLTSDGTAGSTPLGQRSGSAGWVVWRTPTRILPGQAVTLSVPAGAYKDASDAPSAAVVAGAVGNASGSDRFSLAVEPGDARLGMNTTPPYLYFDRGFMFSDLMVSAGTNVRDGHNWYDPVGSGGVVATDASGWPQSSTSGKAAVLFGLGGKFPGGEVPVLWKGAGSVAIETNVGGALAKSAEDLSGEWKYRSYTVPAGTLCRVLVTCPVSAVQVLYPGTMDAGKTGPTSAINPAWLALFKGRFSVLRSLGLQDANDKNNPGGALATPEGYALGERVTKQTATIASVVNHPTPPDFFAWTNPHTVARFTTTAPHGFVTGQFVDINGTGGLPGSGGADTAAFQPVMIYVDGPTTFSVGYYGATDYTFSASAGAASSIVSPGLGLDRVCQVINALECDLWYQFNHLMPDAVVTSTVQYLAAHLDPGRRLYVEHSNEVWNGSFLQHKLAMAWGQQLFGAGSDLNVSALKYHGRRSGRIAQLAVAAWTGAGRSADSVRPVLAGQSGDVGTGQIAHAQATADGTVSYFERVASAPYFGLSTANYPYYPPGANAENAAYLLGDPAAVNLAPEGAILDWMERDLLDVVAGQCSAWGAWASSVGLPFATYEWGNHAIKGPNFEAPSGDGAPAYPAGTNAAVVARLAAASRHPQMGRLMIASFNQQAAAGAREACVLGSIGSFDPYSWHQYEFINQPAGDGAANVAGGALGSEGGSVAVKAWALQQIAAALPSPDPDPDPGPDPDPEEIPDVLAQAIIDAVNARVDAKAQAVTENVLAGVGAPAGGVVAAGSTPSLVTVSGLPANKNYLGQGLYHRSSGELRRIGTQSVAGGNYVFGFTGQATLKDATPGPFSSVAAGDLVVPVP